VTTQPSAAGAGRVCSLPDVSCEKVRQVLIGIANPEHDPDVPGVIQRFQLTHCRMKRKGLVAENGGCALLVFELRFGKADRRSQRLVPGIGVRDNGVQTVPASAKLKYDEDLSLLGRKSLTMRDAAHPEFGHNQADADRTRTPLYELSSVDRHDSPPSSTGTPAGT